MLTATIQNVLNRGLPHSPRAQQLCAELAGRRVAIEAPALARLVVESTGNSLRVTRGNLPADAEVIGGPLSLLALGGSAADARLARGEVEVRGDAELAQKFRELARLLAPDPEEALSVLTGDVAAHRLGRLARGALGWTRNAAATLLLDVGEYFSHERGDLVSREEGEQFLRGVDALREDIDRLDARLELLTQRLAAAT
ncbi:MAG TPA: SCP2 sterol-binding domain-containing protein [Steroidobacteraceae bacterium]|jgi:ubiquinone biosynthesis protein UbiJ|nr:SCP2 sterol-binding domain-containing protein [Steroidobacteraceae bacterium]